MLSLSFSLFLAIGLVHAYSPCEVDRNGLVMCDKTKYQGRCSALTQPKPENWCTTDGTDICCGNSVNDCCRDSGMVVALTTIVLLTFAGFCCCSLICCHARSRSYFGRRRPATPGPPPPIVETLPNPRLIQHEQQILDEYTEGRMKAETILDSKVKECVVCFEQSRNVLLPCGHSILCQSCAEDILASRIRQCPTCRTPFHVYKPVLGSLPSFRELSSLSILDSGNDDESTTVTSTAPSTNTATATPALPTSTATTTLTATAVQATTPSAAASRNTVHIEIPSPNV